MDCRQFSLLLTTNFKKSLSVIGYVLDFS